jgi:UDP-N-acetylmuramoyl-L-alanyl-D-glutamate--2,6-diaminopimelate ligase
MEKKEFNVGLIGAGLGIGVLHAKAVFETEGAKKLSLDVGVPGIFNVYNALAAISAVSFFDIADQAIIDGLKVAHVKGRVEPVPVPGNYSLLIDYAHNALSMENVLTTLRQYDPHRLITMFGAGGNRPKVRRFEMGEVCGNMADISVITTDNPRMEEPQDIINDMLAGLSDEQKRNVLSIADRKEAIRTACTLANSGDVVVVAGKGHEDYQEIKGVKHHFDDKEVIREIFNI